MVSIYLPQSFSLKGGIVLNNDFKLEKIAFECRKSITTMVYNAKSGHIGGSLSSADIIIALYFSVMNLKPEEPNWPLRDRFVLSKGHSVEGYYSALALRGYFPAQRLEDYSRFGSVFTGHPNLKIPGVEMCTGALGHGLSVATGMALAGKMDQLPYRVYTLMGDGEMAEGSNWEAAMAAGKYGLDNLIGIVDRNCLQISGSTEDVMPLEDFAAKWRAFGWHVIEVDGHDMPGLVAAFNSIPVEKGRPHLVIAHTVKGKGISFMENKAQWHHGVLNAEQYAAAMAELDGALGKVDAQ